MGKYMRKAKVSAGEVAVMEATAASLGVRTRARALAMQQRPLQRGEGPAAAAAAGKDQGSAGTGGEYLELRSRKLEKLLPREPPVPRRKAAAPTPAAEDDAEAEQVSFGENVVDMERNARETTPCSMIRGSETISTPGSTTRPGHSNSHRRVQAPVRHIIPTSAEMDEFFAGPQQLEQQAFIDKYNFDPVNDCCLPGRYEWVKLD